MPCIAPGPRLAPRIAGAARPEPEVPLISIVIPAFNRPHLLEEALASIAAQTLSVPLEVIVCDDGRTPGARMAVRRYRDRGYKYLPNPVTLGAVENWNHCLRSATGTWVMVLHEDDLIYPWFLESVLPHLDFDNAGVCVKTSRGEVPPAVRKPGSPASASTYRPAYFIKSSMTPFPGVLMRRELAIRLGGFSERWGPLADYEFWYRLCSSGRVRVVNAVGAFYRVAPGQWTERTWGRMLRLTHLLRLRIAKEQFPDRPRLGRWLARFFTLGNARCYRRRFGDGRADLGRCIGFERCLLSIIPSGWVWGALKFASRPGSRDSWIVSDARRAPQIQQAG
jgi:glycosyltransferase involved in cell wall biosynthesis